MDSISYLPSPILNFALCIYYACINVFLKELKCVHMHSFACQLTYPSIDKSPVRFSFFLNVNQYLGINKNLLPMIVG